MKYKMLLLKYSKKFSYTQKKILGSIESKFSPMYRQDIYAHNQIYVYIGVNHKFKEQKEFFTATQEFITSYIKERDWHQMFYF